MTSTLQQEARALGDPTRHAIFRAIADADQPVSIADITAHFSLHHNAIRQHLAKLVDAGLIEEAKAPASGRGRRRLLYAIAPTAAARWGGPDPYQQLSHLLLDIISSGRGADEVGRQAAPRFRAPVLTGDVAADVTTSMRRQGFAPELRSADGSFEEIVLTNCPFADVAAVDRETVCALHLGIAEGLVEGTDVRVAELVAYDPHRAGCRLRLDAVPDHPSSPVLTLRG